MGTRRVLDGCFNDERTPLLPAPEQVPQVGCITPPRPEGAPRVPRGRAACAERARRVRREGAPREAGRLRAMESHAPSARGAVAVLLAGGIGERAGLGMPKQFAQLRGRTILEHSLAALHDHPRISGVLVVMATGFTDAAQVVTAGYPGVLGVIEGGASRSDSTVRALDWLAASGLHDDVLIHDAARPLVTADTIDRCIEALESAEAVGVAVPSTDTIFRTDASGVIVEVPPREVLWRAQTPQGFRLATLRAAYDAALADPDFVATDDCSVVRRYLPDVPVVVVLGDERNMKVTGPLDLAIAERLLADS